MKEMTQYSKSPKNDCEAVAYRMRKPIILDRQDRKTKAYRVVSNEWVGKCNKVKYQVQAIDCDEERMCGLQVNTHLKDCYLNEEWLFVRPGSWGEDIWKFACEE